jgi:hypothetical protein
MRNNTFYKKEGRKYIPIETYDIDGFGEGLYLITKSPSSKEIKNVLYAVKTHDLQNVGKFSDFYKANREKLMEMVKLEYERFFSEGNKSFSIADLADCIIAGMSKIED